MPKPVRYKAVTAAFLLCLPLLAQAPDVKFKTGQWEIVSTRTMPNGKTIPSRLNLCASSLTDLSNQPHSGETCDPAIVTSVEHGIRVQSACHGGSGSLTFQTTTDLTETFAPDGASFVGSGTTTTTTSALGGKSTVSTATLSSRGRNMGACTNSEKR